jgi:HPt (histidine-containing phosphotransfer) domain-containing protein
VGQASSLPAPAAAGSTPAPLEGPAVESSTSNFHDVLDWEGAQKRVGGRVESIRKLGQLFLQECPKLQAEIRAAIASGDAHLLQLAAHTLKGSADIFSALHVVQAAWELECMGRDGRMENAKEAAGDLDRHVKQLISALETLAVPAAV